MFLLPKKSQVLIFFLNKARKYCIFWGTGKFCGNGETFLKKLRKSVILSHLILIFFRFFRKIIKMFWKNLSDFSKLDEMK